MMLPFAQWIDRCRLSCWRDAERHGLTIEETARQLREAAWLEMVANPPRQLPSRLREGLGEGLSANQPTPTPSPNPTGTASASPDPKTPKGGIDHG